MTLDELIARLQQIRDSYAQDGPVGPIAVVVQCPVAHKDCWVHDDLVAPAYGLEAMVRIQGGFGV
jgi:hypothetical protein